MTKPLSYRPNISYARKQAKKFLKLLREGQPAALKQLQQFHPRIQDAAVPIGQAAHIKLSDAQLALARAQGFLSWAKYIRHLETVQINTHNQSPSFDATLHDAAPNNGALYTGRQTMLQPKISDANFQQALAAIDVGDAAELKRLLAAHPALTTARAEEDGTYAGAYFAQPTLLHFVAENPIRHGALPDNIAAIAQILIDAGADVNAVTGDGYGTTLGLVCSGRVPRESGVVDQLVATLVRNGADPSQGINPALGHAELAALRALVDNGATVNLEIAAALGETTEVAALIDAYPAQLQNAFLYACICGQTKAAAQLLDAGAQINEFAPGFNNGTATALHGAVANEHLPVIRLLIDRGADLTIKDTLFGGTPLGWAEHTKHDAARLLLQVAVPRQAA